MRTRIRNSELVSYLLVTAGTFFMATGINIIYEPLSMVTGGFSGIGIIVKKVLDIPVVICGRLLFGSPAYHTVV